MFEADKSCRESYLVGGRVWWPEDGLNVKMSWVSSAEVRAVYRDNVVV